MTYNKEKLLKELEELVNGKIDSSLFPYQKGNSIRIGKFVVRCNKRGFWKVYDCVNNRLITETFCKSSAVALAKALSQGKSVEADILNIDRKIQKWYNDCMFYRYTMKVTKDDLKYDIVSTRYDIAKHKTSSAKQELDKYIYA